ncbi:CHAD domain-containing protein [Pseudolysobacter antarcticus]|uniref:CHAD domain-containing protein n=2 Tax=Pseudolysobacter antarcticus TaxID=2511995 RepID=A0A411HJQ0_9GAMM|nr:CHAD domain-containing protein [Pseudolysobacter antarcticus]
MALIEPSETPMTHEPAAMVLALLAHAAEQLVLMDDYLGRRGIRLHGSIHEARKAIRRFRAAFALCGAADDPRASAVDHTAQRLGRSLSKLRDAHVLVQLASKRLKGYDANGSRRPWRFVHERLKKTRDDLASATLKADPEFERRRARARALQKAFASLTCDALTPEAVLLLLRQSSARVRRAERACQQHVTQGARHRYRRRLRRLRMQLQCVTALAHEMSVPKEAQLQARWVLREALDTMPGINELDALVTALGGRQDGEMLRRVVRRLPESAHRRTLVSAIEGK